MRNKKMKSFNTQKRLVAIALLFLSAFSTVYAEVFFTSSGGVAADLFPNDPLSKTEVKVRAFFACQLQFGESLLLNGGFSIRTENILKTSFMQNVTSSFSLDEFSLSYRFNIEDSTGQATLFAGEYESAGPETFMARYFGAHGLQSDLLKNSIGQKQISILPINGLGFALSTRFKKPMAAAFYLYYNEKFTDKHMNIDFRFAGVSEYFIGDFVVGIGLPLDKTDDNGEPVVLIIRRADLHIGATMLIGNNPHANIFTQMGITRIQLNPPYNEENPPVKEKNLSLEDVYVFVEPRFVIGKLKFSLSLFAIPDAVIDLVPYVDNSIGVGFSISSHSIRMGKNKGVVGGYITASVQTPKEGEDVDFEALSLKVVPYTEIAIGKGIMNISLEINAMEYANLGDMFVLSTSYKIQL